MEYLISFICILSIPSLFMLLIYFGVYGNKNKTKLSGLEVARKILDKNDLDMTYVVETKEFMSDIYVYKQRVIRLSTNVYNQEYLSSVAIASMKAVTAILHKKRDSAIKLREKANPLLDYLMIISFVLIIGGSLMNMNDISLLAFVLICFVLLFNLVTIPINFKIKNQALEELKKNKLVKDDELGIVNKLLTIYSFCDISNMVFSVSNTINNLFNK